MSPVILVGGEGALSLYYCGAHLLIETIRAVFNFTCDHK